MKLKNALRQWGLFVILAGWVALIFTFSSQSYQKQSIQPALHHTLSTHAAEEVLPNVNFVYNATNYSSRVDPFGVLEFLFRKSAHLFIYAMLAVWAAAALGTRWRLIAALPTALVLVPLIAALDEFNQRRIPGRTSNPQDVAVDFAGGCIGLLLYVIVRYFYRRSKTNPRLIK